MKSLIKMKTFRKAVGLAKLIHKDQKDKRGIDYINHVIEVGKDVGRLGVEYEVVGILHDVLEDADYKVWDYDRLVSIIESFGDDISDAVKAITRNPNEKYFDYIARVQLNDIATKVKLADLKINYSTLHKLEDKKSAKSLSKRYEKAIHILKEK